MWADVLVATWVLKSRTIWKHHLSTTRQLKDRLKTRQKKVSDMREKSKVIEGPHWVNGDDNWRTAVQGMNAAWAHICSLVPPRTGNWPFSALSLFLCQYTSTRTPMQNLMKGGLNEAPSGANGDSRPCKAHRIKPDARSKREQTKAKNAVLLFFIGP